MKLIESLNWRYATKRMEKKKVTSKKLDAILDAIQLSASSFGLQPYTVLVVRSQSAKLKMQAAAYNQAQVGESSHVLVFCVPQTITAADVSTFIQQVADTRGMPVSVLAGYEQQIMGLMNSMNDAEKQAWSAKQAYIALGTALVAAAEQKVDACPMEGFSREGVDKALGLAKKGLKSVVIMPIGYRSSEDMFAGAKKVRKAKEILFQHV